MIRNSAESYVFSSEISVYYTISGKGTFEHPYRVNAYVREPNVNGKKTPIIPKSKKSSKKVSPLSYHITQGKPNTYK